MALTYSTDKPVAKAAQTAQPVAVGRFTDDRGKPANYLGAIRGGFGNPLKNLETERPVSELVTGAFGDALRARGVAVGGSELRLVGSIKRLDCNQYVRREAHVELEVAVMDRAGQRVFARTYNADKVEGAVIALDTGIFASVDELRGVLERTLAEAIDQALDDPSLRGALQL